MTIKGLDALREHVPELRSNAGLARVILALLGVFILTTLFFMAADHNFPEWMPDGEIVVMALGFLTLSRFFSQRKSYLRKYGRGAYRLAFARFDIPGLGIIFASIGHLGYISGPEIPDLWWRQYLMAAGWVLVLTGVMLWIRAVTTFGVDNLAMMYVYFPEESRIVDSNIYKIVRHPVYSAAFDVEMGLALIHANWYALLVALLFPIFLFGWIRLYEEPELIERFPGYLEYRKHTPALWPRPADLPKYFRFLITGN